MDVDLGLDDTLPGRRLGGGLVNEDSGGHEEEEEEDGWRNEHIPDGSKGFPHNFGQFMNCVGELNGLVGKTVLRPLNAPRNCF